MFFRKVFVLGFIIVFTLCVNSCFCDFLDSIFDLSSNKSLRLYNSEELVEESRKKKKKKKDEYIMPLLVGALLVKYIVLPIAFKVMAVMSSVSVMLSALSLIMSSIVGYATLKPAPKHIVKYIHLTDRSKGDELSKDSSPLDVWDEENLPLNYYTS